MSPKAGRDAIEGIEQLADGRRVVKARVRAAPAEGEANRALIRLVAAAFDVAPRHVRIEAGAKARIKRVMIEGDGAAQRASEQAAIDSYRALFDATIEGIYRSFPEGGFIDVNPALAQMFGYASPAEMFKGDFDTARAFGERIATVARSRG